MTAPECKRNLDPLKLVRTGTTRDQRFGSALDPGYAPVDQRSAAHWMRFAKAYSKFLSFYNVKNEESGDWLPFFGENAAVRLAVAALEDVDYYRCTVKGYFDFLSSHQNEHNEQTEDKLREYLGYLFSCAGSLAIGLDELREGLPAEVALKAVLQNLIRGRLAPAFEWLIKYHLVRDNPIADSRPPLHIFGRQAVAFKDVLQKGLSKDWVPKQYANWQAYIGDTHSEPSIYGSGSSVFDRVYHIASHNLFTSIFEQFLKVYARAVSEASQALNLIFTAGNRHEQPHYALFLAFLNLLEYARAEVNTLTGRHLDFYYRKVLQFREKPAVPPKAHLLIEPGRQAQAHMVKQGELFRAGKDDLGLDAFFANDRDLVVNRAKVLAVKAVYRNRDTGFLYASTAADSQDGKGAELLSADKSWPPFGNTKRYGEGPRVDMPKAEIGFAIASHCLMMAEGDRTIIVELSSSSGFTGKKALACSLTTKDKWLDLDGALETVTGSSTLRLTVKLTGDHPPVTPYSPKNHPGYDFETDLPVLLARIRCEDASDCLHRLLQSTSVQKIDLKVEVHNLKSLAVSNDFGPVDTSRPFQPYGPLPVKNSALVIGSKEVFQKNLTEAIIYIKWLISPQPYGNKTVHVGFDFLKEGKWPEEPITGTPIFPLEMMDADPRFLPQLPEQTSDMSPSDVRQHQYNMTTCAAKSAIDEPDQGQNEPYSTSSRHGFVKLKLKDDLGHAQYQAALVAYLTRISTAPSGTPPTAPPAPSIGQLSLAKISTGSSGTPPTAPPVPSISELSLSYKAEQTIDFKDLTNCKARFFQLAPFGHAERPTDSKAGTVFLLPQFAFEDKESTQQSEAEFYIGISDLRPPQSISLLFQVADGTACPCSEHPKIYWSFLSGNEWKPFGLNEVEDRTGGLLNSGIITFAVPAEASAVNTLMPTGMHWIRAAVGCNSDAVCRLLMVAAQALEVTFVDKGNDPAFPARLLAPGTISKLERPDAAIKKIKQPFPAFGGRGREEPEAFYTRVSERLRHKDRAVTLWDYERLVLEAFPEIYQVKCLNHTEYEPGSEIYRELAPGHVTVVTIPNQRLQTLQDPLRPYTSLGLLEKIRSFLRSRLSCFVQLHVESPLFEEVYVDLKVRLVEGQDESFFKKKLQDDISLFLSPWAFAGGGSPSFGGKIYKSVLINFMEDLPYVDFVSDLQLIHRFTEGGQNKEISVNEVEGSSAVSVLVSAREHTVELFPAEKANIQPTEKCPCEA